MQMKKFGLVSDYLFSFLDAKETTSKLTIVETEKRHSCMPSYGMIHMFYIVKFSDDYTIASVPLNTSERVKSFLHENVSKYDIDDSLFVSTLKDLANEEAKKQFGKELKGHWNSLIFACNAETIKNPNPNIRAIRITDNRYECSDDVNFPDHCIPNGIVYSVVEDKKIVSLAHAHKTGDYQDIVADIGVDTANGYRKKGYARECVNAVARHVIERGGESVYICSPNNIASINTALSAGYKPFGKVLIFTVDSDA